MPFNDLKNLANQYCTLRLGLRETVYGKYKDFKILREKRLIGQRILSKKNLVFKGDPV